MVSGPAPPVALVGPTASGKSTLAVALARARPEFEIVSVDSMQLYRGMAIGTASPSPAERAEVPHHLLDLLDPDEEASMAWFQATARSAIADIEARGRRALLVGGTGLYHRAVVDGFEIPGRFPEVRAELEAEPDTAALHARLAALDPRGAARAEPTNRRRVVRALEVTLGSGRPFSSWGTGLDSYPPSRVLQIGIRRDPARLDERIERRSLAQLASGWLDEVRVLRSRYTTLSRTAGAAVGYQELWSHLDGQMELGEAADRIVRRTRRLARRQRSWFGRDPRVLWLEASDRTATSGQLPAGGDDVLAKLMDLVDGVASPATADGGPR